MDSASKRDKEKTERKSFNIMKKNVTWNWEWVPVGRQLGNVQAWNKFLW